jgi:hypothetical protein
VREGKFFSGVSRLINIGSPFIRAFAGVTASAPEMQISSKPWFAALLEAGRAAWPTLRLEEAVLASAAVEPEPFADLYLALVCASAGEPGLAQACHC